MSKPKAVLISDVHYNINTLRLADAAMRQAISKANQLGVPLIVAGDLHDTKANLRAECINAMLTTFRQATTPVYIMIGNHDKVNEKSEDHALNLLTRMPVYGDGFDDSISPIYVIDEPWITSLDFTLIPYQHSIEQLRQYLETLSGGITLIMHQGVHESISGEYIQDKTAIPKDWLADFRVISGHYHTRQDIKTGRPRKGAVGLFSYIGNPYTLSFGEANDPEKGFQILMDDGTLEFVPTNLRKHVVINIDVKADAVHESIWSNDSDRKEVNKDDLVKVKVTGPRDILNSIKKEDMYSFINCKPYGSVPFKLELIPLSTQDESKENKTVQDTNLDVIIESLINTTALQKERLKTLWRELCES